MLYLFTHLIALKFYRYNWKLPVCSFLISSPSVLPKGLILTIDMLALLFLLHMCISYAYWYSIVYRIVSPFFNWNHADKSQIILNFSFSLCFCNCIYVGTVSPSSMILTAVRYCIVQIYYKLFISFLLADYKLPLFPTTTKSSLSFFFFFLLPMVLQSVLFSFTSFLIKVPL